MIQAQDLQIGDFVCYGKANNYITRVEAINNPGQTYTSDEYGIKCHRDKNDPLSEKNPIDYFNVEILYPISLTPEILEENGWEWDGMYATLKYDGNKVLTWYKHEGIIRDFYIHKNGEKEFMFLSRPGIHYVHTLQHALRLCGIDIELKL